VSIVALKLVREETDASRVALRVRFWLVVARDCSVLCESSFKSNKMLIGSCPDDPAGSEIGPPPPVDNSVPFTSRIVIAISIPFKESGPGFLSETGMLIDSKEPTTCELVLPTLIVIAVRAPVTPMAPRRPKPASVATMMKTLTILVERGVVKRDSAIFLTYLSWAELILTDCA